MKPAWKQKLGESYTFVCSLPMFAVLWLGFYLWSFFLEPTDIMGYAILTFYLAMPLFSLVSCIFVGNGGGKLKWVAPVVYAVLAWTLPIAVVGTTEVLFLQIPFVAGLVGVLIGHVWYRISLKQKGCS